MSQAGARRFFSRLQTHNSAELRDTLLPRLISGELRVGEIEDAISTSD
jgi:hypothetical protein